MNITEIGQEIGEKLSVFNEKLVEAQNRFMESNIGQLLNNALDTTLKIALPEFAEDAVIGAKDALLENGLIDGSKQIWNNIKEYGKSVLGIASGKFESVEQVQMATKSGGILDSVSSLFDFALDKAVEKEKITKSERQELKSNKNSFLKNMKSEISEELDNQVKYIEKIDEFSEKWFNCYNEQDLTGMKNANRNIQKYLEKSLPLEKTLKTARQIEIMENLIESTGSFDITDEERELASALAQ